MALELSQLLYGSRFVITSRLAEVFVGFGSPLSRTRPETIGTVADDMPRCRPNMALDLATIARQ
jgi:hypothetical protein